MNSIELRVAIIDGIGRIVRTAIKVVGIVAAIYLLFPAISSFIALLLAILRACR